MATVAPESSTPKRKRASRKGQPRRFECAHDGCEKRYSRAEHLARHELNHRPKEVFRCQEDGCDNTFVRLDLFRRHKKKHEEARTLIPGQEQSAQGGQSVGVQHHSSSSFTQETRSPPPTYFNAAQTSYIRTGAPSHGAQQQSQQPYMHAATSTMPKPDLAQPQHVAAPSATSLEDAYRPNTPWLPDQATIGAGADTYMGAIQANDNFAAWLFDSPGSQQQEFNLTNLPFVDFGMEYSPTDIWNLENPVNTFDASGQPNLLSPNSTITSLPQDPLRPDRHVRMSVLRRDRLASIISSFLRKKRPPTVHVEAPHDSVLFSDGTSDLPNLTVEVFEILLSAYWNDIAKQMPILHQGTFDCDRCEDLLLLALAMLGASHVVRSSVKGSRQDYRDLSDLLASHLRWEIFTEDDAQPPVQLWVAQALLLIELYEKMYSTRRLHERAHIHHASTITLLRRGNPLVGHSGSESPGSELPTRCTTPVGGGAAHRSPRESEAMRWWRRWAKTESMHRVVFAAFQMDAFHAVMFGHDSTLFPYEIRLPLPCDEALWEACSPEEVQRLEATFSFHGIKSINFLDGLKRCLHGHDVQSHHHARLILAAGLFSVGWHISRRERHLQFLETIPSANENERWRSLLFNAYGSWRRSFEEAITSSKSRHQSTKPGRDEFADPTVLYHLAHITMHTDIIDLQILAGYKRLMSRKVTQRDHASVVQRMRNWIGTPGARLAVLHSFKLLRETLIQSGDASNAYPTMLTAYSCRADSSIYRPWILYLASLTIWAYQYGSLIRHTAAPRPAADPINMQDTAGVATRYIAHCAGVDTPDRLLILSSVHGCMAVTMLMSEVFASAESELLLEAHKRLRECARMLAGANG